MYGTSDTPLSIRLARTLYDRTPSAVTRPVGPLYFRYQSRLADWRHRPPEKAHRRRREAPDHVLLIVVDALRPDHVPDLPIPFRHAIAPSTWTFPSVTSMHTGAYPSEHGAVAHTRPGDDEYAMPGQVTDRPTLPTELEAAGYDTYGGTAFVVPFYALRGWYQRHRLYGDDPAEKVLSDYLSWRQGRDRTFGYVHLGDLHDPIEVPTEYFEARDVDQRVFEEVEPCVEFDGCENCQVLRTERLARYRAALDYVEDRLSEVLETVEDDTLVVITGDHGEGQGEHYERANQITDSRPNGGGGYRGNVGHGGTPFDVVARVPVGVSRPDGRSMTHPDGRSRDHSSPDGRSSSDDRSLLPEGGWASLCDLAPTILAETVADPDITGTQWQTEIPDDRAVVCEAVRFGVERKAAYRGTSKVIRSEADDVTFTAEVDVAEPGEQFREIPASERADLLALLPDNWEQFDSSRAVNPVVEEQLEALGYT